MKLKLPDNFKIHPVVHVYLAKRHTCQSLDIRQLTSAGPEPVRQMDGEDLFDVDRILKRRRRRRGFQWLTLMRGSNIHKASWQPTKFFIDSDSIVTAAFLDYVNYNILSEEISQLRQ